MSEPRLSVVLCNYNHADYLVEALGALFAQSYAVHEVIVVDDGSTDQSVDLMEGLMRRHSRLRLLRNGVNQGVVVSGNRGLAAVTGDYVGWYAADDLVLPGFFERIAAAARAHPQAGVISAEMIIEPIDEPTAAKLYRFRFSAGMKAFTSSEFIAAQADRYIWLCSAGLVLRVDALRSLGGWREDLDWFSDWFSAYAIALRHGVVCIEEPLAKLRENPLSFGRAAVADGERRDRVIRRFLGLLGDPAFADLRAAFTAAPLMLRYALGNRLFAILAGRLQDTDLLAATSWSWLRHRAGATLRSRLDGLSTTHG